MYEMIIYTRTVPIFQVAWPLPVYQMATNRQFSEALITLFLEKVSYKQRGKIQRRL